MRDLLARLRHRTHRDDLTDGIPWARPLGPQCAARLEPDRAGPYHGRCELRPHHRDVEHALERGFDTIMFRTTVTGPGRLGVDEPDATG